MKILAIDTATEACSAALLIDAEVQGKYRIAPREHSHLILQMVQDLLSESGTKMAQLDAIAFGRGPGSFMGLRIAAGVAQGMAFAHDLPVIPVSTLKTIAQVAHEETGSENILTAIDARMGEVYWAAYSLEDKTWRAEVEETVVPPEQAQLPANMTPGWIGAGTGWSSYKEKLPTANCRLPTLLPDCLPSAEAMARLAAADFIAGNIVTAEQAVPVYLRNNVAKKPKAVSF